MSGNGEGKRHVHLQYRVPMLTWLRLRFYARQEGFLMPQACDRALNRGMDALGVTTDLDQLIREEGTDHA